MTLHNPQIVHFPAKRAWYSKTVSEITYQISELLMDFEQYPLEEESFWRWQLEFHLHLFPPTSVIEHSMLNIYKDPDSYYKNI